MKNEECLLQEPNCTEHCVGCGWHKAEKERREKALSEKGLTRCEDGLARLIIKRGE